MCTGASGLNEGSASASPPPLVAVLLAQRARTRRYELVRVDGDDVRNLRRTRSVWLSALAAFVTAAVLVWAVLSVDSSNSGYWFLWIATVGIPPIVLSVAAAAQYRWRDSTGAGAAAAAVYWVVVFNVWVVVFNARLIDLFFFGALFQTAAWFISRPRRTARASLDN
jgi:hypothetical protein